MNPELPKQFNTEKAPEMNEDSDIHEEIFDAADNNISRRKFLKIAGLGIAGAVAGISFPSIYENAINTIEKEDLEKSIKELEAELSLKYGIRIEVWEKNPNDRPTGIIRESLNERSPFRAYRSLLTLKEVLECYPEKLIKERVSGIEIVHAVRSSYPDVIPEGATPEASTSFGGTITIRAGYQSSMSYKAIFGDILDANVLHHEIAHTFTDDIPLNDWKNIHPHAEYMGNEWISFKKKGKPKGFALPYSTKSIDEDIATTAELLFANPSELNSIITDDEILQAKVQYLKKWYKTISDGEMNDEYWVKNYKK